MFEYRRFIIPEHKNTLIFLMVGSTQVDRKKTTASLPEGIDHINNDSVILMLFEP
jgi:hypothetical protein